MSARIGAAGALGVKATGKKTLKPPADISYVRLVDSTRLRSANQIFQRRRLCDLPGSSSAPVFHSRIILSTDALQLGNPGNVG